MTFWQLVWRSLWYHRRGTGAVLAGIAVTTAVVTGALVVGDSVRYSLEALAREHLGQTTLALLTEERYFRAALADELAADLHVNAAPVIHAQGVVATPDGQTRVSGVQVWGVEERFWRLGGVTPGRGTVLNRKLAERLGPRFRSDLIVRVPLPSALPRDASLGGGAAARVGMRIEVGEVREAGDLGNFGLAASQLAAYNVFLPLALMQQELQRPGGANVLLLGAGADGAAATAALRRHWRLADAELTLRALPERKLAELSSPRVFLPPAVEAAAPPDGQRLLTYFVNELRCGPRTVPYSLVTALAPMPALGADDLLLSDWAAAELQAGVGDQVTLGYYVMESGNRLATRKHAFTVREVYPVAGGPADREMMPAFPGLADAENCRDWDTAGLPLDLKRVRPQDEEYWRQHRGTPKALISLAAGQALWANRFGTLTAIRVPGTAADLPRLEEELRNRLDPAALGLQWRPVAAAARAGVAGAQDYGGLFIGFSLFLIVAALLLTGLLLALHVQYRADEQQVLLAVGWPRGQVQRLYLAETAVTAVPAVVLGAFGGVGYARVLLTGLGTVWRGAVGDVVLRSDVRAASLALGAAIGLLMALGTAVVALRQTHGGPQAPLPDAGSSAGWRRWPRTVGLAVGCLAAASVLLLNHSLREQQPAAVVMPGGLLLLAAGVFAGAALLDLAARPRAGLTLGDLVRHDLGRRGGRSLAVVGMLAAGSFLLVALQVFRQTAADGADRRSGTGGFALYGTSTEPLYRDLNTPEGLAAYGLTKADLPPFQWYGWRWREGDDTSCLNLNRAQQPGLLAVPPAFLARGPAFRFSAAVRPLHEGNGWWLLERSAGKYPADVVPAIGDANSITYNLGRKLGDDLAYVDEAGHPFRVRLVAALSGGLFRDVLLIPEADFLARFPSLAGYRRFTVEATAADAPLLARQFTAALADAGLELQAAAAVLNEYNRVQNTYLGVFQALGWLGLLVGCAGLGLVVLRNVLERREELALLQALGFSRGQLWRLLVAEHLLLCAAGLGVGLGAALTAVLPNVPATGDGFSWGSLGLLVAGLLLNAMICVSVAAGWALRGELLPALRRE